MASSSVRPSLAFGMEIELLVKPKSYLAPLLTAYGWNPAITFATQSKEHKMANRDALRAALADAITRAGIRAGTMPLDYKDWTVADERSLDEFVGFWRVELVSRAMTTSENWQREVGLIFGIVNQYCDVALTNGCSMHVHVSPSLAGDGQTLYTMADVKNILKAISYFDEAITKAMPADRKANEYAKSNVQGDDVSSIVRKAYRKVPKDTWKPLFRLYDKSMNKQHVQLELSVGKFLSWNFMHLTEQCGTVEFRRPPGVRSATAANHWVSFTLGFIYAALGQDWGPIQSTKGCATVLNLRDFITSGLRQLEPTCQGALVMAKIVEDYAPPTVYSPAELEIIKRKKADKAKAPGPFAVKAGHP